MATMCGVASCPAFADGDDGFCSVLDGSKQLKHVMAGQRCLACRRVLNVGEWVTRSSTLVEMTHAVCPPKRPAPTRKVDREKPLLTLATEKAALPVLLCALLAAPARAEVQPLAWDAHRGAADAISTGLVAGQLAAEAITSWRAPDRGKAIRCLLLRVGLTVAAAETAKHTVSRVRPNGSDDRSFFSEHTALAAVASGWRLSIGVPIAAGVGYGRAAAGAHYGSDIGVGAAVGELLRRVCDDGRKDHR